MPQPSARNQLNLSSSRRPLPLKLRADVTTTRQTYQGRDYWIIKDPVSLKYFRFEEEEFRLLQMLDGKSSPDQIKRRFDFEFAPQKIELAELFHFVGKLYRSCLLVSDLAHQGSELHRRGTRNRSRQRRASLTNILALRCRGFDPDSLLSWLDRWTRYFFTWPAFAAVLLLNIAALSLIFTQFETFQNRLPSFHEFFAADNWIYLALVMAFTKVVHEFGHGLACKRFGSSCHEMGVMFLVFTPCLYCNVSDSWMLPSKWKRALIAAAGIYVELCLASLAAFVWWYSQPGLVNQLALNVIFISSVSTILFNANPLLRYDGYYILSDLLEIPNLRQKSTTVLQRSLGNWLLGIPAPADPFLPNRRKWAFAIYSVAAAGYRWLITLMIFWFVYSLLEPYGLKIIGQLVALTALYGLIGLPLVRLIRFFSIPGRFATVKPLRTAVSTAGALAVLAVILMIPLPHFVYCDFYVQARNGEKIYVEIPGIVTGIHGEYNQVIHRDAPILTLSNPELSQQITRIQGQVDSARQRLRVIRVAANYELQAADQMATVTAMLDSAESRLQQRMQDVPLLNIRARTDGILIAPPRRPREAGTDGRLANWTGTPLEQKNVGAFYDQKTLVGEIVPDLSQLEAILTIDQQDLELVKTGQKVELVSSQLPWRHFTSMTGQLSPAKMVSVPDALSSRNGGRLLTTTDRSGREVPQSSTYLVSVPVDNPEQLILPGGTGQAKIATGSQTLGQRFWRLVCLTFRFDL